MGAIAWTARALAGAFYNVRNEISDEVAKQRRLRLTDGGLWSAFFGRESYSGKSVTIESAMQNATFWACVRITALALSALPIPMFRKVNGSREEADDHPLADIISNSPNVDQTSLEYWEAKVCWLLVTGNTVSEISRGGRDRITALNVLPNCQPVRKQNGTLVYRWVDRGKEEELPRDKVFHIKGFGFGGDSGLSIIRYGVQTFGSALSMEESAGKMFSNGMQANGILKSTAILKKEQRDQLQKIMQTYAGSDNAGKLMILEAGLEYQRLTLSPVDAQMLEQRRFSVEEICRWFGVPPIVIGHAAQGQTMWGSGVEQILLAWLTTGINPLCERIERRITKQLIAPNEQRKVYAEFNREGLLQMDAAAKASFLSSMTQNGLMDRNEGRSKLNLPKRAGADKLTVQSNLVPLDQLGQTPPSKVQPAPGEPIP
jgi:HK97 family phage portal protein